MFPDPNWSRWISASFAEHFRTLISESSFPFYIEGQKRDNQVESYTQLRIEGPYCTEINKDYWRIEVLPFIFIHIVQHGTDIYRLDRLIGQFSSCFLRDIPMFKYGDNDEKFGCMVIREQIRINKFGQVSVATPVQQATIEASYFMTQRR